MCGTFSCMSKKRRTRREKEAAWARRDTLSFVIEQPASRQGGSTSNTPAGIKLQVAPRQIQNYAYVLTDGRRTFLIISIIAALNIVLYLVLKLKIVSLFGIVF